MKAWEPLGLKMYWLTGEEARQREPLLGPDVCAAIYAPEESQIKAPQVVKAFAKAASNLGARIYSHTEAINLHRSGNKITSVCTVQGETITCNHLILAPGARANEYEKWLNVHIPVSPLRGQILSLQAPTTPLKHIIFGDAAYIAPRGNSIIVGATIEEAGFEIQTTEKGTSSLYDTAIKFIPALQESKREAAWAGLRPSTPDRGPLLGAAPGWENVILATGHNSVGIILSPLTGKTIAELITTGHTPEVIRPFSPDRFQIQAMCQKDHSLKLRQV
jgi:glycine oxidase